MERPGPNWLASANGFLGAVQEKARLSGPGYRDYTPALAPRNGPAGSRLLLSEKGVSPRAPARGQPGEAIIRQADSRGTAGGGGAPWKQKKKNTTCQTTGG